MRRHKYIVGMRIQGRARDIALQQSLSERVRGKAHEYNCGKPVLLPLSKLSLSLYELYEGGFSMQRHATLTETDGRITSPTP